jgi:hypothetical protein
MRIRPFSPTLTWALNTYTRNLLSAPAFIRAIGRAFWIDLKAPFSPEERLIFSSWITDLRSGNYSQATGTLRRPLTVDQPHSPTALDKDYGYCCLGVVCETISRLTDPLIVDFRASLEFTMKLGEYGALQVRTINDSETTMLPEDLRERLGISSNGQTLLTRLNDFSGPKVAQGFHQDQILTFDDIANFLESMVELRRTGTLGPTLYRRNEAFPMFFLALLYSGLLPGQGDSQIEWPKAYGEIQIPSTAAGSFISFFETEPASEPTSPADESEAI